MNSLSLVFGYILLFSLFVWIFISNNFYLKIFFLKGEKKRFRGQRGNGGEEIFFEQAYGGGKIPTYIKDSILKSQDKYFLLELYMASKSIVDIGLYNKIVRDNSTDIYKDCAKYISGGKREFLNGFLNILRILAILIFGLLLFIFCSHVFFSVNSELQANDQFIMLSLFCLTILMPYRVYSKFIYLNRSYALTSFMSSIILSFFIMYYFYGYSGDFIFNKDFFSIILSSLIILIGAYSYIGYMKIEFLVNFFELLEVNAVQNKDDQ